MLFWNNIAGFCTLNNNNPKDLVTKTMNSTKVQNPRCINEPYTLEPHLLSYTEWQRTGPATEKSMRNMLYYISGSTPLGF